jgi:hypothetical protein
MVRTRWRLFRLLSLPVDVDPNWLVILALFSQQRPPGNDWLVTQEASQVGQHSCRGIALARVPCASSAKSSSQIGMLADTPVQSRR